MSSQKYLVTHRTHYEYTSESSLCHNQMHLQPRVLPWQNVSHSQIDIYPRPTFRNAWDDVFGNRTEFFSIEELHPHLTVTSRCHVDRDSPNYPIGSSPSWSGVLASIANPDTSEGRVAREFLFDSRHCHRDSAFANFANDVIAPNRSFLESVRMLTSKIFFQFEYSPQSTQVATKPIEVLEKRKGVCQDFAHLQICCLRSLGVPARYVSGYLLTHPAPGKPRLVGADASHAWISVYAGPLGWIDFDPTNNQTPDKEHITVAWGRDYGDVAPIQGVFVGGGYTTLSVSVDVAIAS